MPLTGISRPRRHDKEGRRSLAWAFAAVSVTSPLWARTLAESGQVDGSTLIEVGEAGASDDWDGLVARLGDDDVRRLLAEAAARSDDVARAVRLTAADGSERISVLKAEVDRGLRTRRYLDYRDSSAWARDAAPVVEALAIAVESEPSKALVVLLERAVGHVVKVILRADDSDGMIGDLARQLLGLHERACDAGVADPAALAK